MLILCYTVSSYVVRSVHLKCNMFNFFFKKETKMDLVLSPYFYYVECHLHSPDHLALPSKAKAISFPSCWPSFHGTSVGKSYWFFQDLLALWYFSYPCDLPHTEDTWHMKKCVKKYIYDLRSWVMINVKHLGDKKNNCQNSVLDISELGTMRL